MTTEQKGLQSDIDAREAALDIRRSFIVQAPAGSGKTELLIQRYLRLLATVDNPEEIIAITFTRKAAAEMRLRVLQALKSAQAEPRGLEPYQAVTAAAAGAVLARDAQCDWQLISNPGRMRIQTLDSLNASIARMQPVSAGSGASINSVVVDAEMRALYREAASLTFDQLAETGAMRDATEQVLRHLDNNTSLYLGYLSRMLATRDQWLPFIGSGLFVAAEEKALRLRLERNLQQAVCKQLAETERAWPAEHRSALLELAYYAATRLIDAGQAGHPIAALASTDQLPGASSDDLLAWRGFAELMLTKPGEWRKTVNKSQGFPPGDDGQKQAMLDMLAELRKHSDFRDLLHATRELPQPVYTDAQWSVLLALFRLLPLAVTELKRLLSERGIADYIEVALAAQNALGTAEEPGDIALLLDHQLRHLLVDEMQDTSSAQYRMIEALTGGWQPGDGRTLFCVGDPMQSIYRFRNAEVGQFLLARDAGIGGVMLDTLTLRRNFRSGAKLVDWFNAVFPSVLARRDDAAQSAVSYSPAVSVPALDGQGDCIVHPAFGSSRQKEAEQGLRVIAATLKDHPDDDMAVLVRGRSHLTRLLVRLRDAGIAYRAVEIDRLTDLPEVIEILAITRALVHRGDRLAWLALLRAPWSGLDWTDLHALVSNAGNATVWELLNDEPRLEHLSEYGRAVALGLRRNMIAELRPNRIDSLRDRVERLWMRLGGPAIVRDPQALENVYRCLDVIETLEHGGTLADVAELEGALDQVHVSSSTDARLQVMTMHRAKGLQFDHVLLFGLGRVPGRHERAVLNWFDVPGEHGADEKVISPVGARAELENDPVHRFIERSEAVRFRHELGRLLYVACTRARRSLHLLGHVELTPDNSGIREPRAGSLLHLLWPDVAEHFREAFDDFSIPAPEGDNEKWVEPGLQRFDAAWKLPDFAGLIAADGMPESAEAQEEVEFYWVGTGARIAGTIVHRWLQLLADKRLRLPPDMNTVRDTTHRWLQAMGTADDEIDTVAARVILAFEAVLADPKGRWLLEGDGASELALTGLSNGELVSVLLDRVRIDDDGIHWIVDYKTSSHEGGNLEHFLEAEVARYTPQLRKYFDLYREYSDAETRCALYFPLLQKFVEVRL